MKTLRSAKLTVAPAPVWKIAASASVESMDESRSARSPIIFIIGTSGCERRSGTCGTLLPDSRQYHLCQDDVQGVVTETDIHMPTKA